MASWTLARVRIRFDCPVIHVVSQPNQSEAEQGFDFSSLLIPAVFGVAVFVAHQLAPGTVESGLLVGVYVVGMAAKFLSPFAVRDNMITANRLADPPEQDRVSGVARYRIEPCLPDEAVAFVDTHGADTAALLWGKRRGATWWRQRPVEGVAPDHFQLVDVVVHGKEGRTERFSVVRADAKLSVLPAQ